MASYKKAEYGSHSQRKGKKAGNEMYEKCYSVSGVKSKGGSKKGGTKHYGGKV